MDVNVLGIGELTGTVTPPVETNKTFSRTNNQIFDDFLEAAKGIYNETNTTLNNLQEFQLQIASGESDDFVGLTLMQSKANASMQFFTQLTNKTVEAYKEIMRMQV